MVMYAGGEMFQVIHICEGGGFLGYGGLMLQKWWKMGKTRTS